MNQLSFQQKVKQDFQVKKRCPYCGLENPDSEHIENCEGESPLISVVIPSRVGEEIETLESLKNQTYKNIEIIVEYDEKEEGASVARNRGAEKAKGEFLFFCDNDLVLNPNCLSDLYLTLKSNPEASWAFGKFYIDDVLVNEGRELNIPTIGTVDWVQYFHRMSTMSLIRAKVKPRFDESMKKYNDWDLWLTLNLQGHKPVFCDEILFYTYNRKNGISKPDVDERIEWTNKLYEKHKVFVFEDVLNKNEKIKKLERLERLEIKKLKEEIRQMKSSKFWRLRSIYIKYKKKIVFGLFSPGRFIRKYAKAAKNRILPRKYRIDKKYRAINEDFLVKLSKKEHPKVLAIVNHYYSKKNAHEFPGKSAKQDAEIRKDIVGKVVNELRTIPNVDVKICGIKGCSLFDVDLDFSYLKNPAFIVYESIEWMFSQIDEYDYFINIEDDILLTKETFRQIVEFDKTHLINECFHPNRMEIDEDGDEYCADFKARSGWENLQMNYNSRFLRVAKNPHSGLAILSKPKMIYARDYIDLKKREIIIGYYMASAFANVNSPFLLYRSFDDLSAHKVIHLDNWEER